MRRNERYIRDLFDAFDNNLICVEDANVVHCNALITHLLLDEGEVRIFAGDPFGDKSCEEIYINDEDEKEKVFAEILEDF